MTLDEEIITHIYPEMTVEDWDWLSGSRHLSKDFIKKFAEEVNWHWISIHQKLSEQFIREFAEHLDWRCIYEYQNLSEEFKTEMKLRGYIE